MTMTPDQIRECAKRTAILASQAPDELNARLVIDGAKIGALYEIAAQLAELNHHLTLFSVGNDDSYKSLSVTVFEPEDATE